MIELKHASIAPLRPGDLSPPARHDGLYFGMRFRFRFAGQPCWAKRYEPVAMSTIRRLPRCRSPQAFQCARHYQYARARRKVAMCRRDTHVNAHTRHAGSHYIFRGRGHADYYSALFYIGVYFRDRGRVPFFPQRRRLSAITAASPAPLPRHASVKMRALSAYLCSIS